jgi:hypothetical protein
MSKGLPPSLRRRILLLRAQEDDERSSECVASSELSPTVQDLPQVDLETEKELAGDRLEAVNSEGVYLGQRKQGEKQKMPKKKKGKGKTAPSKAMLEKIRIAQASNRVESDRVADEEQEERKTGEDDTAPMSSALAARKAMSNESTEHSVQAEQQHEGAENESVQTAETEVGHWAGAEVSRPEEDAEALSGTLEEEPKATLEKPAQEPGAKLVNVVKEPEAALEEAAKLEETVEVPEVNSAAGMRSRGNKEPEAVLEESAIPEEVEEEIVEAHAVDPAADMRISGNMRQEVSDAATEQREQADVVEYVAGDKADDEADDEHVLLRQDSLQIQEVGELWEGVDGSPERVHTQRLLDADSQCGSRGQNLPSSPVASKRSDWQESGLDGWTQRHDRTARDTGRLFEQLTYAAMATESLRSQSLLSTQGKAQPTAENSSGVFLKWSDVIGAWCEQGGEGWGGGEEDGNDEECMVVHSFPEDAGSWEEKVDGWGNAASGDADMLRLSMSAIASQQLRDSAAWEQSSTQKTWGGSASQGARETQLDDWGEWGGKGDWSSGGGQDARCELEQMTRAAMATESLRRLDMSGDVAAHDWTRTNSTDSGTSSIASDEDVDDLLDFANSLDYEEYIARFHSGKVVLHSSGVRVDAAAQAQGRQSVAAGEEGVEGGWTGGQIVAKLCESPRSSVFVARVRPVLACSSDHARLSMHHGAIISCDTNMDHRVVGQFVLFVRSAAQN